MPNFKSRPSPFLPMKIEIEGQDAFEKQFEGSVAALLQALDINLESVLVVRGDELLSSDDLLKDTDSIRVLQVISGG